MYNKFKSDLIKQTNSKNELKVYLVTEDDYSSSASFVTLSDQFFESLISHPIVYPDRLDYSSVLLLIKSAAPRLSIDLPNDARLFLENLIYNAKIDAEHLRNAIYGTSKLILNKLKPKDAYLEVELVRDPEMENYDKVFFTFKVKTSNFEILQKLWDEIILVFNSNLTSKEIEVLNVSLEPCDQS